MPITWGEVEGTIETGQAKDLYSTPNTAIGRIERHGIYLSRFRVAEFLLDA
jgi:hypothetical protein